MFELLFEFNIQHSTLKIFVSYTTSISKRKICACLICAFRNQTPIYGLKFRSLELNHVDFNFPDQLSNSSELRSEI